MKKVISILLVLLVAFSLVACVDNGGGAARDEGNQPAGSAKTKVAIISETIGVEPFTMQVVDATKAASEKYGFEYAVMECAGDDDFLTNARAAVHEGYGLIIGVGWKSADCISTVATDFPDAARYAVIDTTVDNENVTSITFDMTECCYVLGVLMASCFPEETSFGIVGAMQTQKTYEQRWGFMEGVKSVAPDAVFYQNFTNSYTDPAGAKELALQQVAKGCKVVCAMAASAGDEGIFSAALEEPGSIITSGQEVDMTTADNDYIISGMLKNTGVVATYIIDNFMSGALEGGSQVLGLDSGATGTVHVTTESANYRSTFVTDEAIAAAKAAADKILSKELVLEVPAE